MRKRIAVWVHGLYLQAEDWKRIVWGEPPDSLGRLPKGVLVVLEEKAVLMGFGTGASEIDGKKEAEFTRDYLMEHFFELAEFSAFQGVDLIKAREKVEKIAKLEMKSQNTREEAEFAVEMLEECGIEKLFLVSSPIHLPRCFKEFYTVFEEKGNKLLIQNLYATPSQTCWGGSTVKDVVIVEPSHRTDRQGNPVSALIQYLINTPEEKREDLLKRMNEILS